VLKELTIATTVQEEVKKQLLAAVNQLYLAKLNDAPLASPRSLWQK